MRTSFFESKIYGVPKDNMYSEHVKQSNKFNYKLDLDTSLVSMLLLLSFFCYNWYHFPYNF